MKSISFEEARAAIDAAEHTRPKSISFEEARAAIDTAPSKQRAFITLDEAATILNREIKKRPIEDEEIEKVEDSKRISPPSRWTWEAWGQGARDFGKVLGAPARDRRHARKSREGLIAPDSPDFVPTFGMDDPFALERVLRRRKTADERIAQQEGREGLWELIRNPLDAMAHDGAMKRIIERSGGLTFGSLDRLGMDIGEHKALEEHEARQLASRQKILANPEQFPAKTVEMAQLAQREHGEKESKTFMQQAGEVTSALYEGVTERPEEIGAALVNAIFADPWVVGAPVGVGLKPVKAARAAVGITGTSRAVTTTDKIADAALVGGAANLLIESQVAQESY
ncbi:MAG: hypothetical protein DDT31_00510 [Syntrophomonadaceae bacterium]|nr:hypothetical protein [Bacillota bacterium]